MITKEWFSDAKELELRLMEARLAHDEKLLTDEEYIAKCLAEAESFVERIRKKDRHCRSLKLSDLP